MLGNNEDTLALEYFSVSHVGSLTVKKKLWTCMKSVTQSVQETLTAKDYEMHLLINK